MTVLQGHMKMRSGTGTVGRSRNTQGPDFFHLENNDEKEEKDNNSTFLMWEELLETVFLRLSTVLAIITALQMVRQYYRQEKDSI